MQFALLLVLLPAALATHYENPKNGCGSDEQAIQVTGVPGDFCSPACNGTSCPSDVPSASDAKPTCALKSPSGSQYCALVCKPSGDGACPTGASCQSIQGTGLCTYPTPGPTPTPPAPPSPAGAGKWTVLSGQFSAITIGIAFKDDKTGWTSQSSGGAPSIVKTTDSGKTWAPVSKTPVAPVPMGVAAKKGGGAVGITGLLSTEYSLDGDDFNRSLVIVPVSQDIKYENDLMTLTQPSGPCISTTNGRLYSCHKVPYKYGQNGRYSSAPSRNVIYHTAGAWPSHQKENVFEVTRNMHLVQRESGAALEVAAPAPAPANGTYIAELWKSSDAGKTWKNLIADVGNFYFNDIHCFDEKHCVAVGEGFADGGSPGARIYVTADGETFKEVHRENTTGGESLMAARMVSATEHWAGGSTKSGGVTAPVLALHSKDSGKTWANEHNNVIGQMITAMDFVSNKHGYATTVNALQISSLLQYGMAPASEPYSLIDSEPVFVV